MSQAAIFIQDKALELPIPGTDKEDAGRHRDASYGSTGPGLERGSRRGRGLERSSKRMELGGAGV